MNEYGQGFQEGYNDAMGVVGHAAMYDEDEHLWWRIGCGHHQNLYEAAVERYEQAEAAIARVRDVCDRIWDDARYAHKYGFLEGVREVRYALDAIEVPHHTTGSRAWCLEGLPEWCYHQIPCDSCQRARQGDPWEIIERLTAEVEALRASVQRVRELHAPIDDPDTEPEDRWCVECVKGWDGEDWSRVQWPCATIRASIWHKGNADGADDVGDER